MKGILIALPTLVMLLCGDARSGQDPATPAPPPATDLVVVRVSGDPITEKQILAQIDMLASQTILTPEQQKNRNSFLFQGAVDNLVTASLLKEHARKQGVTIDKAMVDERVREISKRYPSREAFEKALSSQGANEEGLRKVLEEGLMMQHVLDQATRDVPPATEAEIVKFYNENPDKLPIPERVHAAHILLRVSANATPEQKAEIRKKIEEIRAEIESKKITFADAAAKYSQDQTNAAKGGDLGFFSRGQMVKPFEEAAFGTTPGTISPVIETQFGYHIIHVIEHQAAHKATIDEARPAIKDHLERVKKQQAAKELVDELKAQARIETFMTAEEFGRRHPSR